MASPYIINFTEDNTLSTIGSYRILSYYDPLYDVKTIDEILDDVSGETSSYYVSRSMRWSQDDKNWSLWIDFRPSSSSPSDMGGITSLTFDDTKPLWLEFKYILTDDPSSPVMGAGTTISPSVVINSLDLKLKIISKDPYVGYQGPRAVLSSEFVTRPIIFNNTQFTFKPYDIQSGVNLYQDLSNMVNNMFGIDVVYFRITPQKRSKDVILKEWTIFHVNQEVCMKVLVPNNTFPDSKMNFNPYGIDFEQLFEVHVDKRYWEGLFGKDTMPQHRDVLYIPITNRIYEIRSSYAFRDFMNIPMYYKLDLVKYQPKMDTIIPEDIKTALDDLTITTEELFKEEVEEQIERHTKPQQFVTIAQDSDPIREKVLRGLPIVRENMYNNWTLVGEGYYDMNKAFIDLDGTTIDAVSYRVSPTLGVSDNRSFTCLFNPQLNTKTSGQVRNLLAGTDATGKGVDIDLVFSGSSPTASQILLKLNGTTYTFTLQKQLVKGNWYSLVVNWSSSFKQASVDLWESQVGTSQMVRVSHEMKVINAVSYEANTRYRLKTGPVWITNVRVFDTMIEDESQNVILNQLIVKDSERAQVIDNAKLLLRIPRIAGPK